MSDYASLSDGAIQSGTPQTLAVGTAVYGNLGQDGPLIVGDADVDMYRLTPSATGTYDIRTDTSQEGSADTVLRLFDANGNQIASNDNQNDHTTSSLITADLVAGQTYYVGVSGAGSGASAYNPNTGAGAAAGSTGSYSLIVTPTTAGSPALLVSTPSPVREPMPGQNATLTFTVTLNPAADSTVTVDYATADGTAIAGQDYVAASGTVTFAPGETTKTVDVTVLNDAATDGDETFTLSLTNASNATIASGVATGTIQDLAVKTLTFSSARSAQYINAAGRKVVLKLSGPGTGSALFYGSDATPTSITLSATTARSSLSIMPALGLTALGDVIINGSLASVVAPNAVLRGNLSVGGSLGSVTVAGASGGHTLSIGSGAVASSLSIGHLADFSVTATGAISSIAADSWLEGGAPDNVITATSIGNLTVDGAFAADLNLSATGVDLTSASLGAITGGVWTLHGDLKQLTTRGSFSGQITARTLGTINVGGSLSAAVLRATRAPGKTLAIDTLSVKGAISNSEVRATGNIHSISAATLVNSRIFAGVADAIVALPTSAADLAADATISAVTVKGAKSSTFAVQNSDIAAATLQQVLLGKLKTDNGGTPFGVAAKAIGSYRRQIGTAVLTSTGITGQTTVDSGDAVVRVLS